MPKTTSTNAMQYSKLSLLIMNLLFACLFTACQTLPSGEEPSALQSVPLSPLVAEVVQTQPSADAAQITTEKMLQVADQLQVVIATLPDPEQPVDLWS
ncbi:MAG: hypothetical protein KZQ79_13120, partial [Candidatus Thiodiazotropha sp. (ex Lucinoma borealis)]|nr:hypothetical protein [Candidatus Thiodiazotropha sp. (ex Lucinoma borealis)]